MVYFILCFNVQIYTRKKEKKLIKCVLSLFHVECHVMGNFILFFLMFNGDCHGSESKVLLIF
jgi:hypothetical protein